jgi:hypothetical protein
LKVGRVWNGAGNGKKWGWRGCGSAFLHQPVLASNSKESKNSKFTPALLVKVGNNIFYPTVC